VRLPAAIAIVTSLTALAACVARLPIDGAACPCPDGYCCVDRACAPRVGASCPGESSGAGPKPDASARAHVDGGSSGFTGLMAPEASPPTSDAALDLLSEAGAPDEAGLPDDAGAPDASGDLANDGPSCNDPVAPLCDDGPAPGDACNPTCQTGCTCGHRCAVSNGKTLCLLNYGSLPPGAICKSPTAVGHVAEDLCAPGSVCLREPCGQISRCYRVCEDDAQCDRGTCTIPVATYAPDLTTPFKACTLPPGGCDPLRKTGCPSPNLVCVLTDFGPVCECLTAAQAIHAPCTSDTDCMPALTCVPGAGATASCEQVCDTFGNGCTSGSCVLPKPNAAYGACTGP
jgi:hypothetical protein